MRNTTSCLTHEVVEHRARSFKVGHNAIDQRRNDRDVARLSSLHLSRFITDSNNFTGNLVDGDNGRLIDDYASSSYRDYRARRAHIDGHRIRHEIAQRT